MRFIARGLLALWITLYVGMGVGVAQNGFNRIGTPVQGSTDAGSTGVGYPVAIGGYSGGSVRNIQTDSSGNLITSPLSAGIQKVEGKDVNAAAVTARPVLVGGSDGTSTYRFLTDTSGRQVVIGAAADGAAVAGNPVLMAGFDGTLAQALLTTAAGHLICSVGNGTAAADGAALTQFVGPMNAGGSGRSGMGAMVFLHNGTTADMQRGANAASGTTGTGLLGAGGMVFDATNWQKIAGSTDGGLKTREFRTTLTAVPVLTVGGAYTAGDCFGTKITVASSHPVSGGTIIIDEVTLTDKSDATGNAFDILFWGTDPSASTFTDNSAPSIDETTDLGNLSGVIHLVSGDFTDVGASKVGCIAAGHATANLPMPVMLATTSLYVVVLAQNTNSYAAGDVSIRLKVRQ